jgi:hypothetical protein
MPTEHTETRQSAQAAIDEAVRTVAETSRQTTRQAQQVTRAMLDQSTEISRGLLSTWLSNTEALWRIAFELQNAQFSAALAWWRSLADASRASRDVVQQWDNVSRHAQQAGLEAFEASGRALTTTMDYTSGTVERAAARATR